MLTERDENDAAINPGIPIPAAIAHSPDTPETTSPRASNEPRQNDASVHLRSSVPRPVDAPLGHQVQSPLPCQWTPHFGSYNDRTTVFNQLKASSIPGTQPHDGCQPLNGEIMIGLFFVYLNYTTI